MELHHTQKYISAEVLRYLCKIPGSIMAAPCDLGDFDTGLSPCNPGSSPDSDGLSFCRFFSSSFK